MKPAPETVKDRDTWALLQELDEHGESLTQWEIDPTDYKRLCRSCHWKHDEKHLNFRGKRTP